MPALLLFLALCASLGAAPAADQVDFDRAREYLRKEQSGQTLTAEERAYLDRAKQAFGQRGGGGRNAARTMNGSSLGLAPLTDLKSPYQGEAGGLYGGGSDAPPPALAKAAAAAAAKITPLDSSGKPSPSGRIVLLSVGMSNTTQEFSTFQTHSDKSARRSPSVVLVDGAQGGQSADRIVSPDAPFWKTVLQRLRQAEVTPEQVQAVWLKQAFPGPREAFPAEARRLHGYLIQDLAALRVHCPNVRIVFLSSRIYAGYATSSLNPEPHAYESAFAVRWTILDQLKPAGIDPGAPVLLWGPYLWADGEKGRADGRLKWEKSDFGPDGTHPSNSGRQKVAEELERFLCSDPYAKGWYLRTGR